MRAADMMWKIATRAKDYPARLCKQARKNFQITSAIWEDSLRDPYIAECLDNITSNKLPLVNLKILRKLIEKMNQTSYSSSRKNRSEFTKDLISSQGLITIIIDELERYIQGIN